MLHRTIGRTLNLLKPLVGIAALLYTPAAAEVLWRTAIRLSTELPFLAYFLAGLGGYGVVWGLALRRWSISWLSTFEHELTHALFAILTFNKVTGLKATLRHGGHTEYQGTAHWLIHLGPYFFPTANTLLLVPMMWVPETTLPWMFLAQGVAMGYHLASTYTETHLHQKDLKLAGYGFCLAFLPFANLLSLALLLNGLAHGATGLGWVFSALIHADLKPDPWVHAAVAYVTQRLSPFLTSGW